MNAHTAPDDPSNHADPEGIVLPSPADQEAIEALVRFSMDPALVEPGLRPRATAIARLLSLLGRCSIRSDRVLVDIAFARAMRAVGNTSADEPALVPADEEAMDAWMLAGFDASRVTASLRSRARKHESIARLMASSPASTTASSLVDRTLAAVNAADGARRDRLRIAPERVNRGARIRLNDLVSAAAMLLIGAAVALPILSNTRAYARQTICQANLGSTALGLASYAAANRDALPVATAGLGGGTWWNVGSDSNPSNSANLFTLYRSGYLGLDDLACPGNPSAPKDPTETLGFDWRRLEQVSYSYQVMPSVGVQMINDNPSGVLLADRSPVILLAIRHQPIDPFAKSPNHGQRGQHVLHGDGSTEWLRSPVLETSGDNIWLPRAIENRIRQLQSGLKRGAHSQRVDPIKGNERPATPDDVFLGP